MANYRTIINSLHNCMGQTFMQLLNMSNQNATACTVTTPLLWAGKKHSRKGLQHQGLFPPAFKAFRPSLLVWKASPHHQATCGLTEPLSACTWAGEKPLGTLSWILVGVKGELLFEKGGFSCLSFFKASTVPAKELNGESRGCSILVGVKKICLPALSQPQGLQLALLHHTWTKFGGTPSLRAGRREQETKCSVGSKVPCCCQKHQRLCMLPEPLLTEWDHLVSPRVSVP